jgi:ABC-type molybdate transport system permease subunit
MWCLQVNYDMQAVDKGAVCMRVLFSYVLARESPNGAAISHPYTVHPIVLPPLGADELNV